MKLGKKKLFSLLLGFELAANILQLTHFNFLFTSTLVSFCTCIFLPGFLISLILRISKISFWENLLIVIGLSIAFLEFGGLLLNILLPLFGIKDPLAFQCLVIGFDIYTLLLFIFAWVKTKQFIVHIQLPRRSNIEKIMYTSPVFFPMLAALGAIVLNNGGSNILTLILLGSIALYSLLLVLLRDKIAVDLFPYAIFFIGVASLFTNSLRGWYITGHDIEREFYVFQLTNAHHFWNMAFYQDPYNACLSITILPTILTNLLSIQDIYVYKIIFQILFAISPVLVFFIIRNYTTPVFAFLSAFFFMSFPTFFNDMAMLNRQEIGFIFFGLVLYIMLKRNRTQQFYTKFDTLPQSEFPFSLRRILFIIFGISVIVSHYSTNFVLLTLVTFVYIMTLIISRPVIGKAFESILSKFHIKLKTVFTNKIFLNLPLILILFSMTYIWNTLYTNTSNHASSVVEEVFNSIFVNPTTGNQADAVSYSILFPPKQDPKQQLQEYIQGVIKSANSINTNSINTSQFYKKSIIDRYPSYPIPEEQIPPTIFGRWLSSIHIPVFTLQSDLRTLAADFMQVFVFFGLVCILLFKNKKTYDLQYLLLCFGSVFLLILIIMLPDISVEYGVLRLFQQALFVLSLPIVIGVSSILFFAKDHKRILFTGVIAIIFFLTLTGFISHLTGDYYPQITVDNAGVYYDAYYVHKSDVLAITWLSKNYDNKSPVQAGLSGTVKILTYGHITALDEIFPPIIRKNAYVYLEVSSNTIVTIDKSILVFSSSKSFLDNNKNLIYSNGKDNVYK